MSTPTPQPPRPPSAELLNRYLFDKRIRQITTDFSCQNCGYNLRMQMSNGRCPECGRDIDYRPYDDDRLDLASRVWLSKLFKGACLIDGAVLLLCLCVGATLLGKDWLIVLLFCCAWIAFALGAWLLSTREHPTNPPDALWSPRRLLRASSICALIWSLSVPVLGFLPGVLAVAIFVIGPFVVALATACLFVMIHIFARRMQDDRLIYRSLTAAWAVGGSILVYAFIVMIGVMGGVRLDLVSGCFSCLVAFVFTIPLAILTALVLFAFTNNLRHCCHFAGRAG